VDIHSGNDEADFTVTVLEGQRPAGGSSVTFAGLAAWRMITSSGPTGAMDSIIGSVWCGPEV